ncbi:MAG: NAD(P)/FAD-dependent oxidoreductase [Solirubrobacteraceae bacterium]|nr:NAD(P)/FAD-dependent oxidoreductase [Solirubrobacteraceae bacterium]
MPTDPTATAAPVPDALDVLIVGAGISGISAAYHLQRDHPDKTYAVVDARAASGGTWDQFRYPGIRSDSDLQTFGYRFKPWTGRKILADGPSILAYLREAAREHGIDRRIHLSTRVVGAAWSSDDARWHVDLEDAEGGTRQTVTCRWLSVATGFFRQEAAYVPEYPDLDAYRGTFVHPQFWPEDLDVDGRRVVVIGSGATAMTLVPALAARGARVTMLQRSPGYVFSLPAVDKTAILARRVLGDRIGHAVIRWRNAKIYSGLYRVSQRFPGVVKRVIRWSQRRQLPEDFDFRHLTPRYDPWDQRLCVVPDGDLFRELREGRMSIVTDRIERFTATGVTTASGEHLEADVVVSATGFDMQPICSFPLTVDGEERPVPERVSFRGMMLSDVPNLSYVLGYVTNSWTLKSDLVAEHVSRMLTYLDEQGVDACVPRVPEGMAIRDTVEEFMPGYIQRSLHRFPKQGDRDPWIAHLIYGDDVRLLRRMPVGSRDLELIAARPPATVPGADRATGAVR